MSKLSPVHGEGYGYRIAYRVSVVIDAFWRFTKDFNVVQQAYFDFAGTGFWEVNPWQGGMRDVLRTNAAWEQEAIMRMQAAYR